MSQDELELLIARFIDGELSDVEGTQLDAEIAQSSDARKLLEQHLKLDVALKSEPVLPAINWNALQSRISKAVAGASIAEEIEEKREEQKEQPKEEPKVVAPPAPRKYREPVETRPIFSFAWLQPAVGLLAMAASFMLAMGIWMQWNPPAATPDNTIKIAVNSAPTTLPAQSQLFVAVMTPQEAAPAGTSLVNIEITPPPLLAQRDLPISEAIVPRTTRVAIDSGLLPAQDYEPGLFR